MEYEKHEWVTHGIDAKHPDCLHSPQEVLDYVNQVGFLPLFKNELSGFSVEERTTSYGWWSGDVKIDPWQWRMVLAEGKQVAYGKFFNKRTGFVSLEYLPYFVNFRRNGYDFDTLWEEGKASARQKKIMDLFIENKEMFSFEVKKQAGFCKGGEKNFDGTVGELQNKTYLCMSNFRQKTGKRGQAYGWQVVVLSTPENIWGYPLVTSAYKEDPSVSYQRIREKLLSVYPDATDKQLKQLLF